MAAQNVENGGADPAWPTMLDGETLRAVNEEQGYRYRQRQKYLEEDDRIEIIRRIIAGETQSDLAREFGVTRAAICNTFKNRLDILARSKHVYEKQCAQAERQEATESGAGEQGDGRAVLKTESPREPARSSTLSQEQRPVAHCASKRKRDAPDVERTSSYDDQRHSRRSVRSSLGKLSSVVADHDQEHERSRLFDRIEPWPNSGIHTCRAHAAMLLSDRVRCADSRSFRFLANRLIRLLLEEALAITTLMPSHQDSGRLNEHPIVIGLGDGGYPFIREYQQIFPDHPFGLIQFKPDGSVDVTLPSRVLRASSVLLMTSESSSGATVCQAIRSLIRYGIVEESIFLVMAFTTMLGVARIEERFPGVRGLVARIEYEQSVAVPSFLDRYYHPDSV